MTSVHVGDSDTYTFPITIGVHQGSPLSPYMFWLVMDEVTNDIQRYISWCMIFANDVVLVDETMVGVITASAHVGVASFFF
jgi:hypothetical protein